MPSVAIGSVAVIGAGISGVVTAAHLKRSGIDVTVFERNTAAGGVWLYDERKPLEPDYPSVNASTAADPPKTRWPDGGPDINDWQFRDIQRAPPGPCYRGLTNNVSTLMLKTTLNDFPPNTPEFVSHSVLGEYIRDTARAAGVEGLILFRTLVENVEKHNGKWEVTVLEDDGSSTGKRSTLRFDSVVVTSGHYHAPRVPDIPGLREWKSTWPNRIQHSKRYRTPEAFQDKNVLLIGAGVSSTDIAKEIGPVARTIWQSSRGGLFDLSADLLPPNARRIGPLESFDPINGSSTLEGSFNSQESLDSKGAIPSTVTLKSGQKICDIDHVILATGYHVSLPFLRSYHRDDVAPVDADEDTLVTDGTMYHNLYKDIFYFPDPTLAFVGVPYFTATFTLFEFQAMVVAAVLAGDAHLPSKDEMRQEYHERLQRKGPGKVFHSLRNQEVEYVDELLAWINREAAERNRAPITGHTDEWRAARAAMMERFKTHFQADAGAATEEWVTAC